MTDSDPWSGLVAESMRTFADIEAMGRKLASSIAAEFTAHGDQRTPSAADTTGSLADSSGQAAPPSSPGTSGSLSDITRDMLMWVDAFSDIARDSIFALADAAQSTFVPDAEHLTGSVGAGETGRVQFWLHSASGTGRQISPAATSLHSEELDIELEVRVEPDAADVTQDRAAEFTLIVDASHAAPGTYAGTIEADGVPGGLPVVIQVLP